MRDYVKDMLPPFAKRSIGALLNRARGLTTFPLTHNAIAALIKKPNPTILEIGCNDGSDTLAFLRVMPQAKIYCFEPDPGAIGRFKKNLGAQLAKVRLFEIAVSDRTGQIDFHSSGADLPDGWDRSGSIRRPKNHLKRYPWVKFEKTITVGTCRLDDWCAENGIKQVDFIWMDAQGAEANVIAGARKILQETKFLYTEYSNDELYEGQLSLKNLLARLPSFKVVARYRNDVLLRNRKNV
jgi:2-O-methyltransferase